MDQTLTDAPGAGPTHPTPRLQVHELAVRFGGVVAVDRVNLRVAPRAIHGLIGPNGAGKTTAFDAISGHGTPAAGKVMLDGVDITHTTPVRRARLGVRRTHQRPQPFSWLTVRDNILVATEWRRCGVGLVSDVLRTPGAKRLDSERAMKADVMIERFELDAWRYQAVGNAPLGIVRLVELARALIDNPRLVLLDEPTSGLSERQVHLVERVLRQHVADHDVAIVVVEHDVEFVSKLCETLTVLEAGRVIFDDSSHLAFADRRVRSAYLG